MTTSTVEDYLKAILLEEEERPGEPVATGRIAAALEVAPGTVTGMVKTLAEGALVDYEPYAGVRLTEAGRRLAVLVLRRHRLVELFLVEVMGMDWSEVHPEAERLEHVISERLLERMDEMLGYPSVDPHGDPIPDAEGQVPEAALVSLEDCPLGVTLRVARVRDQDADFLRLVERRGLMPGTRLRVTERVPGADLVELLLVEGGDGGEGGGSARAGGRPSLGLRAASKILVETV